ncbi:MAG: DUF1906 domain-containing protein [Mesorhizobium sp.]|nr:MAG: DUF1906 domain-containing protein [Mesorhizobium sp.]
MSVSVSTIRRAGNFSLSCEDRGPTVIRYYARSARPKTIIPEEAKLLSRQGFGILPIFQDSCRHISNLSSSIGTANAKSAMGFAKRIGQPKDRGSTIFSPSIWTIRLRRSMAPSSPTSTRLKRRSTALSSSARMVAVPCSQNC